MTSMPSGRVHAFTDDAMGDHDAVGLAEEIRAGRVSRAEVVEAAIARVETMQPRLNAVAVEAFQQAREESWRKGHGFFSGVPTLVKDNSDVAGLPTNQGSAAYVGRPKQAHGDFAQMYLGQGLINLGKSQLSEFGFNASAEYPQSDPVRNPWDTDYSSGASSAGSAALVAAGAVPIAHANDGGGSIRIPAAVCGLVGLKPTRGRIPQDKTMREMPVRIVADGVVTRSVRDTAAFMREAELLHRNLRLRPVGDVRRAGRKRLRVAMVIDSVNHVTDPECAEVVRETARLLESLGHHVEEVDAPVPSSFERDFLIYWGLLALFLTRTGRRTLDPSFDRHRTDNLTQGLAHMAGRNLHRLPLAMARLQGSQLVSGRFFKNYDVTLTPVLGHPTPQLGHLNPGQSFETVMERLLQWVTFTPLQNATGEPAISLPMGAGANGMPIGIQLGAPQGREDRLLEVAYELEEARPFRRLDRD